MIIQCSFNTINQWLWLFGLVEKILKTKCIDQNGFSGEISVLLKVFSENMSSELDFGFLELYSQND